MEAIMDVKEFKRIIDNTKKFVGMDSKGGGKMKYIHLEINAEEMTIRATALDGHKISMEYAKIHDADKSFKCFIKPNIPKIENGVTGIALELKNGILFMVIGENITAYVQPDGIYYEVDKIIKREIENENIKTIGVNAKYLLDALQSVKNTRLEREDIKLDIRGENKPITIRTKNKDGLPNNIKLILPVVIREEW